MVLLLSFPPFFWVAQVFLAQIFQPVETMQEHWMVQVGFASHPLTTSASPDAFASGLVILLEVLHRQWMMRTKKTTMAVFGASYLFFSFYAYHRPHLNLFHYQDLQTDFASDWR